MTTATYVLTAEDHLNSALSAGDGERYVSPPQPLESALVLARMLGGKTIDAPGTVTRGVPGGTRQVIVAPADEDAPGRP